MLCRSKNRISKSKCRGSRIEKSEPRIKAVLFDLGETLINFGRFSATRVFRQGARLSYDYLKSCGQQVGNFEYYCWVNLITLRLRHLISGILKNDFNSTVLLRSLGRRKGVTLDGDQWRHFAWLWYEPLSKIATVEPKIKETLTELQKMGLKLGILSNTFISGRSLEKHLAQVGILDFFPVRLYSYEFDFRKPDTRIFKIAAERIGEAVESIIYIGDRIDKDIEPALKIGMKPVLKTAYTNAGKTLPDGALRIDKVSELSDLIRNINTTKSS